MRNARRVVAFVVLLAVAAVVATVSTRGDALGGDPVWWTLAPFAVLLTAAEYLFVRFRYGGEVDALNPFEAVLAPLLFAFPAATVVPMVVLAQIAGSALRRNAPLKSAFNVAQWAAAAALGSATLHALGGTPGMSGRNAAALVGAMVVVGVTNQAAFTTVLWLVDPKPARQLLRGLSPVVLPGWVTGWALNTVVGLLFTFAFVDFSPAVFTFIVPLGILHASYRAFAGVRSDRVRLTGLHVASRVLAEPLDPLDAVPAFLAEVCRCFEADAAELVLVGPHEELGVHRVRDANADTHRHEALDADSDHLVRHLLAVGDAVRLTAAADGDVLRGAGWRDCLAAPLVTDARTVGLLAVYDQVGLEGFEAGERAVLAALAREVAVIFEKGSLLGDVLEERHKLRRIVDHTSDGIVTLGPDGVVRSWNPGMEAITGRSADDMVGQAISAVRAYDRAGDAVRWDQWSSGVELPADLRIVANHGQARWLSCSYSTIDDQDGTGLVLIARDTTKAREVERLRHQYGEMVEREATQREFVHQLQETVRPPLPSLTGVELAVHYLPSDPSAPTGGDLYDWQVLADGSLYLAIVDVLGKGVAATKDALSVVHTLRALAFEGYPLRAIVGRADALLFAQNPNLAATALVAHFDPRTRQLQLAGGGHPPPLLVSVDGTVEEVEAAGTPIGWPGAGSDDVVRRTLRPGETVVFYTDGLVEARKDIVEGIRALAAIAATARRHPVDRLARELVESSLAGAARHDDSLALVLRAPGEAESPDFRERVPDGESASPARRNFSSWLAVRGVDEDARDDLVVVLSELVTNALNAGASYVDVRARVDERDVTLEVVDDGPGLPPMLLDASHEAPEPTHERGRGLFLVRSLTDAVELVPTRGGTTVRCRRRVHCAVL